MGQVWLPEVKNCHVVFMFSAWEFWNGFLFIDQGEEFSHLVSFMSTNMMNSKKTSLNYVDRCQEKIGCFPIFTHNAVFASLMKRICCHGVA